MRSLNYVCCMLPPVVQPGNFSCPILNLFIPPTAADHPHCFSCKLELASDQEIPTDWFPFITMECEVADTVASQTRVKSLGIESDIQPQKHISYRAFYRCQVEIEKKLIEVESQKSSSCATQ